MNPIMLVEIGDTITEERNVLHDDDPRWYQLPNVERDLMMFTCR
jgi:hypothetical protein